MIKKIFALVLILAIVALIAGCGKETGETKIVTSGDTQTVEKTATETSADEVSAGLEEVDALNEDLDTSELDTLDQELDNITW